PGGENISSIDVEIVLNRHPAVQMAAVVARPDEKWGETPCAFVQLRPGAEATSDEIIEYCRGNLPHFAAPRTVVFGPLPTTATGKIQKYALREQARAARTSGSSPSPLWVEARRPPSGARRNAAGWRGSTR